jgi:general secretion pathway protein F
MQFEVRALSRDHLMTRFTVDAQDEEDARRQVEAQGWFAASITPARRTLLPGLPFSSGRAARLRLVPFSQDLLTLLNAGLSIVEALEALLDKETNEATSTLLTRLLTGLREGKRLSSVMAEQPGLFPSLYTGIIRTAEGTSDMARSLSRFIDYQKRIDSVRNNVISASIYPLLLLLVGGGVTLFLVGFVIPRFAEVYQGTGRNLPWLSQLLLDWSRFATNHARVLLSVALIGLLSIIIVLRHFLAQGALVRLLSKLPGVGEHIRAYELSRLYLTLGMLLEGGIPIVPAMETVQAMVSANIREALDRAAGSIQSGAKLSIAFEEQELTTPVSLRMLRVGERSGELGQMLAQSATYYDDEISRWTERFTRTFEPLLITAIGLIVGAIVVLLYLPIFDLAGSFS